jgi:glycosyltransferase involved in cell wall biosynthesis
MKRRSIKTAFILGGLRVGGYEILNVRIANELVERGYPVLLISLSGENHLHDLLNSGVKVYELHRRQRVDVRAFTALRSCLKIEKPDVVVACDHLEYVYPRLANMTLHHRPLFLMAFHVSSAYTRKDHQWNRIYAVMNRVLKDNHIAIHRTQIDFYADKYGIPRDRFHLIYNGIDTDYFSFDGEKEYMPDRVMRLVHVASIKPLKDQWTLVKAIKELNGRLGAWHLNIAGEDLGGTQGDLQNFLVRHSIQDKVSFLGRVDDVKALLKNSDLFILTSRTEALPVSVIEALAMEVPAIVTNVGGNPDIVTHGVEGYLFEPGDYRSLAEKIKFLYDNPEIIRSMGSGAREKVTTHFGFQRMVDGYVALFHRLHADGNR